jgi:flavorubredoxin
MNKKGGIFMIQKRRSDIEIEQHMAEMEAEIDRILSAQEAEAEAKLKQAQEEREEKEFVGV